MVQNRDRVRKIVSNKREFLDHVFNSKLSSSALSLIQGADLLPRENEYLQIHPEYFISKDSTRLISQFARYKRYGMSVLYPEAPPHIILQAFDIIQNELDKKLPKPIKNKK